MFWFRFLLWWQYGFLFLVLSRVEGGGRWGGFVTVTGGAGIGQYAGVVGQRFVAPQVVGARR